MSCLQWAHKRYLTWLIIWVIFVSCFGHKRLFVSFDFTMQLRSFLFPSTLASSVWFRMASKIDSVFYINYDHDLKVHSVFKYRPVYFIKSKLNQLDCFVSIRFRIKSFLKPRSINFMVISVFQFCLGFFLASFPGQQVYVRSWVTDQLLHSVLTICFYFEDIN